MNTKRHNAFDYSQWDPLNKKPSEMNEAETAYLALECKASAERVFQGYRQRPHMALRVGFELCKLARHELAKSGKKHVAEDADEDFYTSPAGSDELFQ